MIKRVRLQLSRRKGFELQALSQAINGLPAIVVSRPSRFGNPFIVGVDGTRADCVRLYQMVLGGCICVTCKTSMEDQLAARQYVKTQIWRLRGKNLACWCALPKPGEPDICHAGVLLELADR